MKRLSAKISFLFGFIVTIISNLGICVRNALKVPIGVGGVVHVTDTSHQDTKGRGLLSFLNEVLYIISVNGEKDIDVTYHRTVYNDSPEDNMWDYYFEPIVSDPATKKIYRYFFVTKAYKNHRVDQKQKYRNLFHSIINDRIRIKKYIMEKADQFYNRQLRGEKCLGVHYRGGEDALKYISANPYNIKYPLSGYFEKVDNLLSNGFTKIFLATDDPKALEEFNRRYGNKVVSYSTHQNDVVRGIRHITAQDRRILGEEVLIDCLLLSRCDYLLHGASNIPVTAKFISPTLQGEDVDVKKQAFIRETVMRFLSM